MILLRLKIKHMLFTSLFFLSKTRIPSDKPKRYEGLFTGESQTHLKDDK